MQCKRHGGTTCHSFGRSGMMGFAGAFCARLRWEPIVVRMAIRIGVRLRLSITLAVTRFAASRSSRGPAVGGDGMGWDGETKARLVAESFEPGRGVSEVARCHDISPSLLFLWRRQAAEATKNAESKVRGGPAFVPMVVAGDARAELCSPKHSTSLRRSRGRS